MSQTNRPANAQIDGYFIYKHDAKALCQWRRCGYLAPWASSFPALQALDVPVEGAYQMGSKQDATVGAPMPNAGVRGIDGMA